MIESDRTQSGVPQSAFPDPVQRGLQQIADLQDRADQRIPRLEAHCEALKLTLRKQTQRDVEIAILDEQTKSLSLQLNKFKTRLKQLERFIPRES